METPLNLVKFLNEVVLKTAQSLNTFGEAFSPEVRIADPRFGDYQANGVLPYAKKNRLNPRELAQTLIDALKENEALKQSFSIEIAGPGFINFKMTNAFVLAWITHFGNSEAFAAASQSLTGKNILIDYSSPNTAKQMHVGHLRSLVIGEAIQRMLRFCGANIIRDNHLGDWGTQFGILLMQIKDSGYDLTAEHEDALEDLERLYKEGSKRFKEEDGAQDKAREELLKLQQEDPENFGLWQKITEVSYGAFKEIYDLFNVTFDHARGESFYRNKLDRVYEELKADSIAELSQGAWVVFHPEHPRFKKTPFIIRKADGASNYASTDLATVLSHVEDPEIQANEIIYVTDGRQQDHFAQLFLTAKKWFQARNYPNPELRHAWFGTILGEDGKAIKTRSGDPIRLKALVNEAIKRAFDLVSAKNPELPENERNEIARIVGIGALRYADLSQNRTSDYVFSWDKMISFEGNTAPYLQYAVARIHSIFRKVEESPESLIAIKPESLGELGYAGRDLARKLIEFPTALNQAIEELKPHFLCTYLYELAGTFSSFYNADKVIVDDPETRKRRLTLCARTLSTLKTGVDLLGIETLEAM